MCAADCYMLFCRSLLPTERHMHCWLCITLGQLQYVFGTKQMQLQSASAMCFGCAAGLSLTSFKCLIYVQYMICSAHVSHPPIVRFGCAQCMQRTSTPTKVHIFHFLVIVQDILQDLLHFANPRRQPVEHGFAVFDHIQCFARHLSGQNLMVRQPGG